MQSNSVLLKRAKALIPTPDHLARYTYSRNSNGDSVPYESKHAVKFCMCGAIYRACFGLPAAVERKIESIVADVLELKPDDLTAYTETHSHEEIMATFDKAIASALAEQSGVEVDDGMPDVKLSDEGAPEVKEAEEATPEPTKKTRKPRTKKEDPNPPAPVETAVRAPIEAPEVAPITPEIPPPMQPAAVLIPGPLGAFFV